MPTLRRRTERDHADGAWLARAGSGAGVIGGNDDGVAAGALPICCSIIATRRSISLSAGADNGHLDAAQVSGGSVAAGLHIAPVLTEDRVVDDGLLTHVAASAASGTEQNRSEPVAVCKEFFMLLFSFSRLFDFRRLENSWNLLTVKSINKSPGERKKCSTETVRRQ